MAAAGGHGAHGGGDGGRGGGRVRGDDGNTQALGEQVSGAAGVDGGVGVAGSGGGEHDAARAARRVAHPRPPAGLDEPRVQRLHEQRVRAERGGDTGAERGGGGRGFGDVPLDVVAAAEQQRHEDGFTGPGALGALE